MTGATRAYLALTAGKRISQQEPVAVYDRDSDASFAQQDLPGRVISKHPGQQGCSVARDAAADNYCIICAEGNQHVCLALYGKLFEGFDHATASHFNGFVDGGMVTLYDFRESNFFVYDCRTEAEG